MKYFSIVILHFCFLIISNSGFAQTKLPTLEFTHYTSERGLPSREIQCGFKDSKGFLWITTIDGAYRYDGYEVKAYKTNFYDSTTINIGWAESIAEDKNGLIWFAGTFGMGLNQFDPSSGKFKRYNQIPEYRDKLPTSNVCNIFIDDNNVLWLSSQGEGIFSFDTRRNKIVHYYHIEGDSTSINSNTVYSIVKAPGGNLYVATERGFELLNVANGRFKSFETIREVNSRQILAFNLMFADSKSNLWTYCTNGITLYDKSLRTIKHFSHSPVNPNSLSCDTVNSICESGDGRIWIATNNGLNIFDYKTGSFQHYFHESGNEKPFVTNSIYKCFYDRSGKIWLLSENSIDAVDLLIPKFRLYKHDDDDSTTLCNNFIEYIYKDKSDNIFVCTANGLCTFNAKSGTFKLFQPDQAINSYLKRHFIFIVYQDSNDNYWINVDDDKLICFNPHIGHSDIYHYEEHHHPDSLGVGNIWSIYEDARGIIWFGGSGHLSSYDRQTKKFSSCLVNPGIENTDENSIPKIAGLNDDKILFTCAGHACYDYKSKKMFRPVYPNNKTITAMIQVGNSCYLKESPDLFWFGTMGNGLFVYDFKSGRCRNFTSNMGLPNNVIWGILKDQHGNLWISTNNGLCRFTPPKLLFDERIKAQYRNYNLGDGIPAKEFAWNEFCQSDDGTMYFGLSDESAGLLTFHPDSLKQNNYIPPVYITDFKLFNESVVADHNSTGIQNPVEYVKHIDLTYNENVISFAFSALSFIHPEQNKYAYKLEGFDKEWNYTDASKRFANYTNLDPKEYIFKVKASNNDGIWNETPAEISLTIYPPFWETWWFRLIIIALAGGMIYAVYRYRLRQVLQLQTIRNNIAADLHDEIGSTLNSISVFSEVAKNQAGKQIPALENIGDSSRSIIDSMSDIVWTINPDNDRFENIVLRMRNHAYQLLKAKDIQLVFQSDISLDTLSFNMKIRKNIYLIFKESLHNVVKYSGAKRVNIQISKKQNKIKLEIRDNGIGFDINQYNSGTAGGNGIGNMKRRAGEINGVLLIESRHMEGTVIELILKL
jgi:ligand-binding sensor domain-containing protein/two-component sensor histidine kinase